MERIYSGSLKFDRSIMDALNNTRLISLRMTFQYKIQVSNWSVKKL